MSTDISKCHEEVSRKGELQPCDKTAVGLRMDDENKTAYPVCSYHARGDMVSLAVTASEFQAHALEEAIEKLMAFDGSQEYSKHIQSLRGWAAAYRVREEESHGN